MQRLSAARGNSLEAGAHCCIGRTHANSGKSGLLDLCDRQRGGNIPAMTKARRESKYSVEVAPYPCVRQDLGGWTAVFRVRDGRRIAKVEILPGDGRRRSEPTTTVAEILRIYGIESLEDAYKLGASMAAADLNQLSLPEVELTGRMVRTISPSTALRHYVDGMHSFLAEHGRPFLEFVLGPQWKEGLDRLERTTPDSPSEARRLTLATTAARYVDACERDDRSPVLTVAKHLGLTHGQIRDRLHAARVADLLSPISQGARGGVLTAAAVAILKEWTAL